LIAYFKPVYLLYCQAKTEKPMVVLKLYKKSLLILLNIGVSMHFG